MTSYKNVLQEQCHRLRLDRPVYSTKQLRDGGFVSVVTCGALKADGAACCRKKDAEAAAAMVMIEKLEKLGIYEDERSKKETSPPSHSSSSCYLPPQDPAGYLLIDLENVNNVDLRDLYSRIVPRDYCIMGFLATNNHQYQHADRIKRYLKLNVIHSSVKDSCDHLMTFVASAIFCNETVPLDGGRKKPMIVFTKDHIGSVMVDLVATRFDAVHVTRLEDLRDFLSSRRSSREDG